MVRRTVSLPEAVDRTVREASRQGESYSATVARLIEAGARALKEGKAPAWIGSYKGKDLPRDFSRHYERYLNEAIRSIGKK